MGEGGEAVVKWKLNSSDSIEPLKGKNDLDTVIYTFVSQDALPLWALVRSNEGWWNIFITLFQTLTLHSLHYVCSESMCHAVPTIKHTRVLIWNIIMYIFLWLHPIIVFECMNICCHLSVRHLTFLLNIVIKLTLSATHLTALSCRISLAQQTKADCKYARFQTHTRT